MKKSEYYSIGWDARWKLGRLYVFKINGKEYEEFLQNCSMFWKHGDWTNDVIYISNMKNYITMSDLINFNIRNSKTNFDLGYRGYNSFAHYFMDIFLKKYCKRINIGTREETFAIDGSYDEERANEIKKLFFEELKVAIKETTDRLILKNKRDNVKDKIQNIENEIDCVIKELGESWSDKIRYECLPGDVATASILYVFRKELEGSWGTLSQNSPRILIRKLKTGKYMIKWVDMNKRIEEENPWKIVKNETTPDDFKNFLTDYFKDWLNIPNRIGTAAYPSWINK